MRLETLTYLEYVQFVLNLDRIHYRKAAVVWDGVDAANSLHELGMAWFDALTDNEAARDKLESAVNGARLLAQAWATRR